MEIRYRSYALNVTPTGRPVHCAGPLGAIRVELHDPTSHREVRDDAPVVQIEPETRPQASNVHIPVHQSRQPFDIRKIGPHPRIRKILDTGLKVPPKIEAQGPAVERAALKGSRVVLEDPLNAGLQRVAHIAELAGRGADGDHGSEQNHKANDDGPEASIALHKGAEVRGQGEHVHSEV